jgi:hypothetical protein
VLDAVPVDVKEYRMSDSFDWDDVEKEAKIVNEARETVVYLNTGNDVVIRQRANFGDDDDPFLVIPLYRVRALIDRLDALLLQAHTGDDVER